MKRYYGFDLGDAESAVAVLMGENAEEKPEILPVGGEGSFITAYARKTDGTILIGEDACYQTDVTARGLRFKSRFLADRESEGDIRIFASGVMSDLIRQGKTDPGREDPFYIGCPAGWDGNDRERYRGIFESAGFPPVRIVSESRAALISACRSRYLQVGYDILSRPVLVIDIGSSTTDFAYIEGGREIGLQTAGEVTLGGGIMDRMLLENAVSASEDEKDIRRIFSGMPAWESYCEFACRKLKEKYFSDEEYWREHVCSRTLRIRDPEGPSLPLTIHLTEKEAGRILEEKTEMLSGRSFKETFLESLAHVREKISGHSPELVLLTGGVSAMKEVRKWCADSFPDAVTITGREPQFSVARGLAYSGRIDEDVRLFRREVDDLIESSSVEMIVSKHIDELYRSVVDTMVEPILDHAVMNVFDRWRAGEIRKLSETDGELKKEIAQYLRSEKAQKLLGGVISSWLRPVTYELESYTMPICLRHNVPFRALNLTSYLSASDVSIEIDTRNVFGVEQITWMINAIIAIMAGILCGGSGIALIASGLKGIAAGAVLSMMVLLLGKEKMEDSMMNTDIPKILRKSVSRRQFQSRIRRAAPDVKARLLENLETEKNEEISARMTEEISRQIEQCLLRMAEVVEIPLGS